MSLTPNKSNILQATEYDLQMMLACFVHLGTKNLDQKMEKYSFKRKQDGTHIINLAKTWEKLVLAARIIVAIENPRDICVVGSPEYAQRAVLKFANFIGARYHTGKFTSGLFTNRIQPKFMEPRLLIVTDPLHDAQPLRESAYANIPVIAFCSTDTPCNYVDCAIPCNNKGRQSIALMYWMLAREVLRMKDEIPRRRPWDVKVDLFFYRDPEEVAKLEQKKQTVVTQAQSVVAYEQPTNIVPTEGTTNWNENEDENEEDAFVPLTDQENAQIIASKKKTSEFFQ